jgi:hypothetical protein
MKDTSFLDQIARLVVANYKDSLTDTIIILPNKRARVFLIEALQNQVDGAIFCPEIVSIEDFIQEISNLSIIDPIELLFEFYEVYLSMTEKSEQQSFELFANWGKTLLNDFNEIDRYLIEPKKIFNYLENIKEIEHWSLDSEPNTTLIEKHLQFWKLIPNYYSGLYSHLLARKKGYQGLIYRQAERNLSEFASSKLNKNIVFAGFNALNKTEEIIFQHFQSSNSAQVYWDIDQTILNDSNHSAGLFLRNYKDKWKFYKTHTFQWINNDFTQPKDIRIMGTPKSIGQAKIVGSIIEDLLREDPNYNLKKTAIILGEENLLIPLLHSLPIEVDKLNVTMGYSSKNNPAQVLVAQLLKTHCNAISRDNANYVFYYKDVLDLLTHPLIEPYVNAHEIVNFIKKNNYSFITQKKLFEIQVIPNELFTTLFDKCDLDITKFLTGIASVLNIIKDRLNDDREEEKVAKAFLFSIFKVINKLISYSLQYKHIDSIATLQTIYKQIVELAEVSFEGEPLDGLQIMGVLESRVLDFETVIITSLNEGKFPAGKSHNSFIPYDVKREYELPTFKEKDAIYTYHFYHLLQRAKNIFLVYNTESEGIDAGEKSRFITQLEMEKKEAHLISHEIYHAAHSEMAYQPLVVPKSESVLARLSELAKTGFSPSSLTSYIRNPIDFYFQKILQIREIEEVEETIAVNTLGTIIHETLKMLYLPLEGKFLSETILKDCLNRSDDEVLNQFKLVYKEGEIKKGRNLLAFEVAKRHVQNFLQLELENIKNGEAIKILAIEKTFKRDFQHPDLPFPILIKGNVDRIDERNGTIRIIDYKTGKVEKRNMTLKVWDGLTTELKNDKIIQILAYAYMFFEEAKGKQIEAGIISFKNLKSGFLPFLLKNDDANSTIITAQVLDNFMNEIVVLLKEIFDTKIPFEEKVE